jgi:Uma2 family endonuclease
LSGCSNTSRAHRSDTPIPPHRPSPSAAASTAQPDIYVQPGPRRPAPDRWEDIDLPILVVEVLSPSTAWNDRQVKRRKFQRLGIPEYWIVDLDARLIERWKPADSRPEILTEVLEWLPVPEGQPLTIDLTTLFDGILGPR